MSGKLRIVVATVAFGMGINKNNLRAVIHYNMPSSFERFVQEVGRAGRDGLPAHCHLFLDSQGKDSSELRRHIYSDSTDRHILRKLLLRVFKSCKCKNAVEKLENWDPEKEYQETPEGTQDSPRKLAQVQCPGHEVAFLTEETVQALDLPEENILTLLCYLELHPKRWLEVLSPAYVTCKVTSYGGSAALKAATKKGKDLSELRRHIYSDSTDRHILRKLLLRVFKSCKCKNAVEKLENGDPEKEYQETPEGTQDSPRKLAQVQCPGHEVAFLTEETVQALDLPEENILTLLCYLELHPKRWLEVLSPAYVTCKVTSYGGSAALKAATKKCPPLAMAVALDQKAGISHEKSTSIEFPVVDVASAIGWDSGQAKRQLKELEWRKVNDKFRRSSLVVQLSGPGLRVLAKGCLPPEDLDEALDWLMARPGVTNEDQVRANVCSMVSTFTDTSFTGRAIARIFHGIASPCFPPHVWGRTRFWRLHLNDNFTALCKIASSELLRLRT
ncbi:hypothetical protein B566_EDAN015560 [Ephemera danica]|nr:hypothetical protein B566_EDAN015560 [Ephemera danica]